MDNNKAMHNMKGSSCIHIIKVRVTVTVQTQDVRESYVYVKCGLRQDHWKANNRHVDEGRGIRDKPESPKILS